MRHLVSRRTLLSLIAFTAIGALVGLAYARIMNTAVPESVCIGVVITTGISMFEQYFARHPRGRWLRRAPLLVMIAVSTGVWLTIIGLSLYLIPELFGAQSGWFRERVAAGAFRIDVVFSILMALAVTTAIRLRTLIGGRVLLNFLSGRYRHPVNEERIFLFMDLAGSTTLAEQLGPVAYHAFLRDFIELVEISVADYGGEIYQYVGDEVVITWPVGSPQKNVRAPACYFALIDLIASRRAYFEKHYQATPQFSAGIHCGDVVAGEIGDNRRQVVFVGDVVNTASRVESIARADGLGLVVSGDALSRMQLPEEMRVKPLGDYSLKGKATSVSLFQLTGQPI